MVAKIDASRMGYQQNFGIASLFDLSGFLTRIGFICLWCLLALGVPVIALISLLDGAGLVHALGIVWEWGRIQL